MTTRSLSLSKSEHIGNVFSRLQHQIGNIDAMVRAIDDKRKRLTARLIELESAGITDATPFYQQGKYLYLIHPMRKGKRVREYIGSDIKKRHDAEVRIANYTIFYEHFCILNSLEDQVIKLLHGINQLIERNKSS